MHSYPDLTTDRRNVLGQRKVDARTFLQKPVLDGCANVILLAVILAFAAIMTAGC